MAKNPPDFLELRAFLSQESDTPDIRQQKLKELCAAELLIGFDMDVQKAIDYSRREVGEPLMGRKSPRLDGRAYTHVGKPERLLGRL
jgi:hypothetical protein